MNRALVAGLLVAGFIVVTIIRVQATHTVFSPTWDEPAHIYAGYEYLVNGEYRFDKSHPPLTRIVFAFPLRHARSPSDDIHERIGDVLMSRGSYMAGVAAARRGNLLFLVAAIAGVAALVALRASPAEGVLAAAIFALLPPVLAHAGLATTDMGVTAAIAIAATVLDAWTRRPDWPRTATLAVVLGAGLLTKFSFPVFFAIAALSVFNIRRKLPFVRAAAAVAGALVIVWAGYFFRQLPRFFTGFAAVLRHAAEGHEAYFLGQVRSTGWWEYFPIILSIKTPVPVLVLAAAGVATAVRDRQRRPFAVMAVMMLLAVMPSHMNLGVRHILPIYVPLAALGSIGAVQLWHSRGRWLVPVLFTWLVVNSVTAHPDYLPWMNAFAGKQPQKIVLDSNFDWGQDVLRLRDACRAMHISVISAGLVGTVDYGRIGMPTTRTINRYRAAAGWYAVSEGFIIPAQVVEPAAYRWLTDDRPFRRIGKTIRLYHVGG